MEENRVPLSTILEMVTSETLKVHEAAGKAGHHPVMQFRDCELDFAIDIETKGEGEGKFDVWVAKLGAGVKRTESNTIKVRYTAREGQPQVALVEGEPRTGAVPERTGKKEE